MLKVKMFGDFAADTDDLAAGFTEALRDWSSAHPGTEIVTVSTSLAYDPDEVGVHGIMTVMYREAAPPKED